jgi:putative ABC transport system permease protein
VQPGSRVRERELLQLPAGMPIEPLRADLRTRLTADHARVSGYRDAQPQLKQFLEQLSRYLGLIGLTALFIGGLGVAMSIHAFMREKLKTIAILKTLGADSSILIAAYVLQAVGLGLVGSIAGMVLGLLLQRVLPPLVAGAFVSDFLEQVGASTELSLVSVGPLVKGGALGLLTTVLFSLWPLLRVRDIAPAAIFRREVDPGSRDVSLSSGRRGTAAVDRVGILAAGILLCGLGVLSVWQAGSWRIGGWYLGGVAIAMLTLLGCAQLLVSGLRLMPNPPSITLRYALGNVVRPGGHTAGILVAIGISAMVIVTVSLVERALLRPFFSSICSQIKLTGLQH